jgi:hypothetical protein
MSLSVVGVGRVALPGLVTDQAAVQQPSTVSWPAVTRIPDDIIDDDELSEYEPVVEPDGSGGRNGNKTSPWLSTVRVTDTEGVVEVRLIVAPGESPHSTMPPGT